MYLTGQEHNGIVGGVQYSDMKELMRSRQSR